MGAFWADAYTDVEPKRVYRWILSMGGIPQWIVKKVNKPSFELTSTEHKYLNHTFYYPGRVTYETVSVTLVDPVNPDATHTMMEILRHSGYNIPVSESDLATVSKFAATNALGLVTISQIASGGSVIESFDLMNAWVTKVNFGELDYENDTLVDIVVDLRYDFARMGTHGTVVSGLPWGPGRDATP
tara:strand:- start:182 stop:739 length:558 start_codon:yes stop_codon:yes gene_type:complete